MKKVLKEVRASKRDALFYIYIIDIDLGKCIIYNKNNEKQFVENTNENLIGI